MIKGKKICCFFNHPAHYRERIYKLMDDNFDCTFVLGDEVPSIKEMDCNKLKRVRRVHYCFFKSIAYVRGVLSEVKNHDFFIATPATNSITHWILAVILKSLPSKKLYFWTHGYYGKETKRQYFFKRSMFKLADGLFLYGDYAKQLMIKDGFNKERLHVIHNSLNYLEHKAIRKQALTDDIYKNHFQNNLPTIIVIGRLNKRKKLDLLLNALAALNKVEAKANVVLIGDGEDRDNLVQRSVKLGIEKNIWFYGACYDEKENAKLIYNADICVVPGDIGLTAIHTMTFGVPVISHNYYPTQGPEFEVIEPNVTGDFFELDNEASLAECLQKWLKKIRSDREQIRKACMNKIDKEWTPEYQINIMKSVLNA